jgi:cytochrome c5
MIFNFGRRPVQTAMRALLVVAGVGLAGCTQAAAPDGRPIASMHSHQCGRCHVPPEPKTRTRAQLEDAVPRHDRRVHMSHDDWQAMIDYLAAPAN